MLVFLAVWLSTLAGHAPNTKPRVAVANAASGLAAGDYHGCALTEGGGVKCWGWNPYGQLGDGRACSFFCPYVVSTTGLESGVESLAAGGYHTCAIVSDGGVNCWGANSSGQLGDNSIFQRLTPVDVVGLSGPVAKLTAGYNHTCALMQAGGVQCWGSNGFGQGGAGFFGGGLPSPADVVTLGSDVVDVSTGGFSTCAVLSGGAVKCWGYNSLGQLGDGTTQDRSAPTDVVGVSNAIQVSVGESHACALTSDGGVKCWGSNHEGQLGDGTYEDHVSSIDVPSLTTGVAQITSGGYYTCALTTGGAVTCWGDNSWGQLGDVQVCGEICTLPVAVSGLASGVSAIDAGLRHACAITSNGGIKCWGANDTGQLAIGKRHAGANPTPRPPNDVDLKAPITVTPPPFPTSTPTPPGATPGPTPTPFGACGASPNSITNGPRVGMTTDHSTKIWVRSCREASVLVEYKSAGSDWSTALSVGPTSTDVSADNIAVVPLNNLQSNSAYEYRVRVDGQFPLSPLEGRFRTLPPEGQESAFSFLVGTDMHLSQYPMEGILNSVRQHDPLFGVLDGDTVLAEIFQVPGFSQAAYERIYSQQLSDPAVRSFQANVPTAMIWSDHEIYNDWDHRTSPPYPYARRAFDEYMGAVNPPARTQADVQFSFKAADIEFYVIDNRTFRSPNEKADGPDKTMLGTEQKQDLKNWLLASTARFKFIVSDVWWNDFSGHAVFGESWPAYRTERNELFDFIQDNHVPGVVLISGDEHATGVFHLQPWGLYEVAPGPMSWTPGGAPSPDPQILYTTGRARVFGIFDVDTTACPATLEVNLYNDTNQLLYTLPLTERDLGADTDGNGLVPCEEVPTATPTRTPSPTPTRTPTPQRLLGDANCDGNINSIDAAIILQVTAGLLSTAPCPQNADVNHDGRVNSIDASLVLQYAAGLLDEFP